MLKPNRRSTPRHNLQRKQLSKKSAQVHLSRIQSQFKKKLKQNNIDADATWIGLVALLLCFLLVIVLVIYFTMSGDTTTTVSNGNHATLFNDLDEADPEHWPHHLREKRDNIGNVALGDNEQEIQMEKAERNKDREYPMKPESDDRKKMEEYLERKIERTERKKRGQRERVRDRRKRDGIPDDIELDKMSIDEREELMAQLQEDKRRRNPRGDKQKERRQRPDKSYRSDKEKERRERERKVIEENMKNRKDGEEIDVEKLKADLLAVEDEMEMDDVERAANDRRSRRRRRDESRRDPPRRKQKREDYEYDAYQEEMLERDRVGFDEIEREQEGRGVREQEGGTTTKGESVEEKGEEKESNWLTIWSGIKNVDMSGDDVAAESEDSLTEKAYRIKSAFLHAWHGYAKHAMGHDEIQPVSDLPGDSWGGLGATLIDALDTMMLMGIVEEFKEARAVLEKVDFSVDLQVSFFETTIRHLGGLIGAYEMSKLLKPKDDVILKQAISLADHLLPAFNTDLGIPKSMVNLQSGEIKNYGWTKDRSVLSEVGSNQIEMYAMSEYTDDSKYYDKSANIFKLLDDAQRRTGDIGLFPRLIETDTASFPRNEKVYSLGGMSDSFYEYLLKLWIVSNYNDKLAIKMYMDSIDAANEQLLRRIYDKRRREEPYYFYGEQWYNKFRGKMEELECFMPGLLALGSYHAILREEHSKKSGIPLTEAERRLINAQQQHLKLAHVLVESCVALYDEMPTGLAPESIEFSDDDWNPKEMKYQLRPETVESLFILYSLTGNEQYRQWAWNIFESIEKHCRTEVAYSGIQDVTEIPAKPDNQMQSYVMAETFKYLYLLFDDYAAKLLPLNEFVFNTEAHPVRIITDIKSFKWYRPEVYSNDNPDGEEEN